MFDPVLIGHRQVRERLLERLEAGALAGSLLFTGPDGVGKRRVAMELAQRELCFRHSACGQCEGCRLFQGELPVELPNLLRVAPEGKAGLIRISAIRGDDLVEGGVIQWAHRTPPPGCHRWVLLEDAHRLNEASANMLLKTLEEPPATTHFLLVSHRPEAVLATIRSRCERIAFGPLEPDQAWAVALRGGWAEANRESWTALSAGTLRYLEPEAFQRAADQVEAWIALGEGAPFAEAGAPLLPVRDAEASQGEQVARSLEILLLILADVARCREGLAPRLAPWAAGIGRLGGSDLALERPQVRAFEVLRNLTRNPSPDSLLREVGLALVPSDRP
jgi:DNA polymerase-3 subunit delta'